MKRDHKLIVLADRPEREAGMDQTSVSTEPQRRSGMGRAAALIRRATLIQRFALSSFVVILLLGAAIAYLLGRSIERNALENLNDRGLDGNQKLLQLYIPILQKHQVTGAFEIYQPYVPVQQQINQTEMQVYTMLGMGLLVLYLLLFGIVRRGSKTIVTQQRVLLKYTGDLEESYNATIASLAAAVDARDTTTEKHAERVTELSVRLACSLGWPEEEIRQVERGALLHDVGKIGISDSILLKPDALTPAEWDEMRKHPDIGHQMLRRISFLQNALPVVRHHHERWDGQGYPDRLRGTEIPLAARLFAVIDAYDAITSDRPYRQAASTEIALERITQGAGSHFDPMIATAFVDMMRRRHGLRLLGSRPVAS